jgi:hypothetical protein
LRSAEFGHTLLAAVVLSAAVGVLALCPSAAAADTTPPHLDSLQPADGSFVNGTTRVAPGTANVLLSAVFQDDASAIDVANVTVAAWSLSAGGFVGSPSYSASEYGDPSRVLLLGSIELQDGDYRLDLGAADVLGNTVNTSTTFTVDVTPPQLEVAAPSLTNESQLTVRFDARDGLSGMALQALLSYRSACSYTMSSKAFQVVALPGRLVGETSMGLCVGADNRFTVVVADRAGNTASVERTDIIYDAGPPTFSDFSPTSFTRVDGPRVSVTASVTDDAVGVNRSRVQAQLSKDGGLTFGNWTNASTIFGGAGVRASVSFTIPAGATAAVRWRAWDLAGNGPSESRIEYFYVNGAPFVVTLEPAEGTVVTQFTAVRLYAEFADPDADPVTASFRSDIDGPLGAADGRRVQLSVGVHNLTLTASDGHGHLVNYTYQVQIIARPPPDPRPLLLTAILAGIMVWVTYAAWTKEDDPPGASLPKA